MQVEEEVEEMVEDDEDAEEEVMDDDDISAEPPVPIDEQSINESEEPLDQPEEVRISWSRVCFLMLQNSLSFRLTLVSLNSVIYPCPL